MAVGFEVCKYSFTMLQVGGFGGGNNVDGLDDSFTLALNAPTLDSSALLSNFFINLFNSVIHTKNTYKNNLKYTVYDTTGHLFVT